MKFYLGITKEILLVILMSSTIIYFDGIIGEYASIILGVGIWIGLRFYLLKKIQKNQTEVKK